MEYVEGETVSSMVRRGPVAPEQVIDLGIQLASALEEAHSHGVIHRDLKPANVLVTRAGKPKILDFGLARRPGSGESAITAAGHVVGTPGYMSPEQMLGYGADPRSLQAPPTSNMDAYAEFSQGRDFLERTHDPENIDRAITLLESAVGRDPTFVLAQAALGEAYWNKFQQTTDSSWTEKARIAAEEARRLDPDHPAVRYALAVIYHGSGRVEEAMEELNRALALQPNNDDVQALLGKILAEQGSGRGQIRAAVKGNADTGCYKYDIEATGLETLDPVLEIDN